MPDTLNDAMQKYYTSVANRTVRLDSGVAQMVTLSANVGAGGTTAYKVRSAASVNSVSVKGSSTRLYAYQLSNLSAGWKFVRFYNKATAPVVGTDVPLFTIAIPPNGSIDLNISVPITFATGLAMAITGASADLDATAVADGDVVGHLQYI
jgi:hypothetical protein